MNNRNQKDTIKIVYLGDSHCNGACVDDEHSWRGKLTAYFGTQYETVTEIKLCSGGETTFKGMPVGTPYPTDKDYTGYGFYMQPDPSKNIDFAISTNPDLVILEYSGNDLWLSIPFENIISNLDYFATRLNSAGIKFAMTGIAPRQTLISGEYYEGLTVINQHLKDNYPANYIDLIPKLAKEPYDGTEKIEFLCDDNLHNNELGHIAWFESVIDNEIIDQQICNCKGFAFNKGGFIFNKEGSDIHIKGILTGYKLTLSGSNDYTAFSEIQSWRNPSGSFDELVTDTGYKYYKLQLFSTVKKPVTITKLINP